MAPRRVKVNKFDYKKLTANDVICPICRSILIKPITLPCSHGFCSSCFETTTQNANLVCPLCRVRVGSWLRTASKSKKLINETFWQAIQDLFPMQVRNKLKGVNENFVEDKYKTKTIIDNKKDVSTKIEKNLLLKNSIPSTSKVNSDKNGKAANMLLNNFATKEYTCRILCQNVNSKDTVTNESLTLIQRKNKRIQKITESESDRSNSIESECLYFKPIDYRHNPPSEGLTPIKVPTRKPNVSPDIKILAPCGQNQININSLESAFARLFSATSKAKNEIIEEEQTTSRGLAAKRKHEKLEYQSKKKLKSDHKLVEDESKIRSLCDNGVENNFSLSHNKIRKCTNVKHLPNLLGDENTKRSLQEKADFELAKKLQQTYNQSAKYSTRSTVLKRAATKRQVKIEGFITPYKVN